MFILVQAVAKLLRPVLTFVRLQRLIRYMCADIAEFLPATLDTSAPQW